MRPRARTIQARYGVMSRRSRDAAKADANADLLSRLTSPVNYRQADGVSASRAKAVSPKPAAWPGRARLSTSSDVLTTPALCKYTRFMPRSIERKRAVRREKRVSRTYRLPLSKLKAAQQALGAATATEAIERALDLAVLQRELVDGTRAMLGVEITSPDLEP